MIGVHRWLYKRNPDGPDGETWYLECERCQKQKYEISTGGVGFGC
jgi:hypothetical protein